MFLRWLLATFPQEMRQGWALVRPDLMLWLALFSLISVSVLSLPKGGEGPPPVLPFLIAATTRLVTAMLPPVLFTAQLQGLQLTWGPVLALMARKVGPLLLYTAIAFGLAWAADTAIIVAMSWALGDSPALIPLSTVAGIVVLVSILVRFSFLPFIVMLLERDQVPPALWQWQRGQQLAPGFWPLTLSARLTEHNRWRILFYIVLGLVLPSVLTLAPGLVALPLSVVALGVLMCVQGVLFLHYRRRCEETGVPDPRLPLEQVVRV
jgi:hypothetical protein